MDVLCTDKTGTLTQDHVILQRHCDVAGDEDDRVLVLAYLNSHLQTGLKNVLDRAVLEHREHHHAVIVPETRKIDEIPFDFSRRHLSVVVEIPDRMHRLICKGAPEQVFERCSHFELDDQKELITDILIQDLPEEHEVLSREGFRVLALAYRDFPPRGTYSKQDEVELVLAGYVSFATSQPVSTEIPTSETRSAGESLMPSPRKPHHMLSLLLSTDHALFVAGV